MWTGRVEEIWESTLKNRRESTVIQWRSQTPTADNGKTRETSLAQSHGPHAGSRAAYPESVDSFEEPPCEFRTLKSRRY